MDEQQELRDQLDVQTGSNDLIYATIGIFAIIVFVLMLLVRVGATTIDQLKVDLDQSAQVQARQGEELDKTKSQRDTAERERDDAIHEGEQLVKKIDELEGQAIATKGVSIAIACDQTGSMANVLARLRAVLLAIAEMFPMATDNFNIGVVLYGNGPRVTFPLQRIKQIDQDGGDSLAELQDFATQMKCAGGQADIGLAVAEAMEMLDAAPNSDKSRQLLMVCGDVSHGECVHHGPGDDDKLVRTVAAWATASGKHRRVLGLHTGVETHPARAFYERLGQANQESGFGSDPAEIFKSIFAASFGK
ncbi:vWA domain-containing protein [Rubripirellula reticaptiva]|uniref:von Willebrand factor type A domain protein n=1 Tax=Rubripirellula reticaptiva TaxID=2528013 RepID=A0A5C6EPD9_9BACT|nr:vWA domain-containing protein [Rubripirellula reticaptiva]TWU49501.1 von Willebrand factor type A domain protein [Rubripirellula reticaptiva]